MALCFWPKPAGSLAQPSGLFVQIGTLHLRLIPYPEEPHSAAVSGRGPTRRPLSSKRERLCCQTGLPAGRHRVRQRPQPASAPAPVGRRRQRGLQFLVQRPLQLLDLCQHPKDRAHVAEAAARRQAGRTPQKLRCRKRRGRADAQPHLPHLLSALLLQCCPPADQQQLLDSGHTTRNLWKVESMRSMFVRLNLDRQLPESELQLAQVRRPHQLSHRRLAGSS